jgi:hypothetical protein
LNTGKANGRMNFVIPHNKPIPGDSQVVAMATEGSPVLSASGG